MGKARVVVIVGPTASGKSTLALELAGLFNGEIISADSMQVYRYMDIGTAKPSTEERKRVAHHLIDVAAPDEEYTAERFGSEASEAVLEIRGRGKNVFIAGGTGLYIKALLHGICEGPQADNALREELLEEAGEKGPLSLYERLKALDPAAASVIHPNNLRRVIRALEVCTITKRPISDIHKEHGFLDLRYDALKIGLTKERASLYRDIEERVERMIREGLLEETKALMEKGYGSHLKPMCGLGYKEMAGYLNGGHSLEEALRLAKRNTRRYAKRQLTWFRRDKDIRWFTVEEKGEIIRLVKRHLS